MKTLAYDDTFKLQLDKSIEVCSTSKLDFQVGALVGLVSVKQSILLHFAPCPPLEAPTDKLESWIREHAKQVSRMLPGGVDILGIGAICSPETFEKQKTTIKQALLNVHKTLSLTKQLSEFPQRCVLHIDPKSKKLTSRLYDVTNVNSNGSPQDVKVVKNCSTNCTFVNAQLSLKFVGHLPKSIVSQNLQQQLAKCLTTYETTIEDAEIFLENQKISATNDPLTSFTDSKELNVTFLQRQATTLDTTPVSVVESGARIACNGHLQLLAVLPARSTSEDLTQAIRQDAIRNLKARLAMHCEDLQQLIEDEQKDKAVVHELPKRVFLRRRRDDGDTSSVSVPFCDFVFQGDDPSDCLQAFKEILGLDVTTDQIETPREKLPDGESRYTRDAAEVEEFVEEFICEGAKQLQKDPTPVLKLALAFCILVLAVGIALLLR